MKQQINLTESELNNIITESIKKYFVNEDMDERSLKQFGQDVWGGITGKSRRHTENLRNWYSDLYDEKKNLQNQMDNMANLQQGDTNVSQKIKNYFVNLAKQYINQGYDAYQISMGMSQASKTVGQWASTRNAQKTARQNAARKGMENRRNFDNSWNGYNASQEGDGLEETITRAIRKYLK